MEETEDVYDNTYADFIGDNTRIVGGSTVSKPFMLDEYIDHGTLKEFLDTHVFQIQNIFHKLDRLRREYHGSRGSKLIQKKELRQEEDVAQH